MPAPVPSATMQPMRMVLVSGKRAAGKDLVADLIQHALETTKGLKVARVALGTINKRCYAEEMGVDLARLQSNRAFKETHRIKMIHYHTQRNKLDPEWCLAELWKSAIASSADVLILSDLRTLADLRFFEKMKKTMKALSLILVRVDATDEARKVRGWEPDVKKDSLPTEVELDALKGWSACVDNSDNSDMGVKKLEHWVHFTALPRILAGAE